MLLLMKHTELSKDYYLNNIMRYLNELGNLYSDLLCEDLQSSLNQARNILKNNGIEPVEQWLDQLKMVPQYVAIHDEQNRVANKDSNLPALAYWLVADGNLATVDNDYSQYINTPSLWRRNYLNTAVEDLKNEISAKKLFKPSVEKRDLIRSHFIKIAETIHRNYVPPKAKESKTAFKMGSRNEDVVYEDDDIIIYRADDKHKCIKYGTGSNLCISNRGGGNYYWKYRMGKMRIHDDLGMTTYFIVFKNEYYPDGRNKVILVDHLGDENGPVDKWSWNQIFDDRGDFNNDDYDITPRELIKKYPELENPFKQKVMPFIPYGKNENRYLELDQQSHRDIMFPYDMNFQDSTMDYRLNDFLDNNFEDVDMAIEAGWNMQRTEKAWDELAKLFPRQIEDLVKKYAFLEVGDKLLSDIIPIRVVLKYLSKGDINKYLKDLEDVNPTHIQSYFSKALMENPDSEILADKVFSNSRYALSFVTRLSQKLPNSARDIPDNIAKRMAPNILDYLEEVEGEWRDQFRTSGLKINDWISDNLFNEILKYPDQARHLLERFVGYDELNSKWTVYTPNESITSGPIAVWNDRFKKLVDVVSQSDHESVVYLNRHLEQDSIPEQIWNAVRHSPKKLDSLRHAYNLDKVPDKEWNNALKSYDTLRAFLKKGRNKQFGIEELYKRSVRLNIIQ